MSINLPMRQAVTGGVVREMAVVSERRLSVVREAFALASVWLTTDD